MKLVINYDFFDAVLNVNEGFTPMKIVRNNKKVLGYWYIPVLTILNLTTSRNIKVIIQEYILEFGFFFGGLLLHNMITGIDDYKDKSKKDLKELASKFNDLYLKTDYDLLLESELYDKKYKVSFNKENLLQVVESKYILVPTYDFNNNIKNTSIMQDHIIGTNEYVLSIGSPKKAFQKVYSNI